MHLHRCLPESPLRHPLWAGMSADLPIEQAAWIGPATWDASRPLFLKWTCSVQVPAGTHRFHLSADQRYQLRINGQLYGQGPDRSDVNHWSFATYELEVDATELCVEIRVWWLPRSLTPLAQMSHRPGLVLKGEGVLDPLITTGIAEWTLVDASQAVTCVTPTLCGYHAVGPEFQVDMRAWEAVLTPVTATVLRPAEVPERWGTRPIGWRLHPSRLPEQRREHLQKFRLCSFRTSVHDGPWKEADVEDSFGCDLRSFLAGEKQSLDLPSGSEIECLIDLGTYVCGYPEIKVSGGRNAELRLEWAESLFEAAAGSEVQPTTGKGRRDSFTDKVFHGFGDAWTLSDGPEQHLPSFWWRSGRFVRLILRTSDDALRVESFAVRRTGFPYRTEGTFHCDDPELNDLWPLLVGGLENCAHEQWVDCPYYEQLSYVGDNTTELAFYCLTRDDALTQRSLELFDWSRHDSGWVAERYPSAIRQDSFTYALLYPGLVRDHAFWRRDPDFVGSLLPGVRAMMHECLAWVGEDGLVHQVPGWSFMDWVPAWDEGCGPGVREGDSSLVNVHLSFALRAWQELEEALGEAGLVPWIAEKRRNLDQRIKERFWCKETHLLADDSTHQLFSEHAQAWGLLSSVLTPEEKSECLQAWLSGNVPLAPMSIYFSHYGLEALYRQREAGEFFTRLSFWKALPKQGFCTTPEQPEPSRSDCHGWGAHPLFHLFASMAGIRPASPGFHTVRIAPLDGPVKQARLRMPHPEGMIEMEWTTTGDERSFRLMLPGSLHGTFEWRNQTYALVPGNNVSKKESHV